MSLCGIWNLIRFFSDFKTKVLNSNLNRVCKNVQEKFIYQEQNYAYSKAET